MPTMVTAHEAFAAFERQVETFAGQVVASKAAMAELRARAESVWAALQAAQAADVAAGAQLTAATAGLPPTGGGPDAVAAVVRAETAYGDAHARASQLASEWEECVAQARRIRRDLLTVAEEAAATIRALPGPPAPPGASAGGATSPTMHAGPLDWVSAAVDHGPAGSPGGTGPMGLTPPYPPVDAAGVVDGGQRAITQASDVLKFPIEGNNVYTLLFAAANAGNLRNARKGVPWRYVGLEGLSELMSKDAVAKGSNAAMTAGHQAKAAADRAAFLGSVEKVRPLTAAEAMERSWLVKHVPDLHREAGVWAKTAESWKRWAPVARGAGRALGGLAIVDDLATIVKPWDQGAQGVLGVADRGAAAVNLGATVGALAMGSAFPVVGQAVLLGTGIYLAGRWAYGHSETVRTVVDSGVDFTTKAVNAAWSGAQKTAGDAWKTTREVGDQVLGWIRKW